MAYKQWIKKIELGFPSYSPVTWLIMDQLEMYGQTKVILSIFEQSFTSLQ